MDRRETWRELAAIAKRARKREKREEDARRSEEGRALPWITLSARMGGPRLGLWDMVERRIARGLSLRVVLIRWRLRLEHRRHLPMPFPACWGMSRSQSRRRMRAINARIRATKGALRRELRRMARRLEVVA